LIILFFIQYSEKRKERSKKKVLDGLDITQLSIFTFWN